MEGSPEVLNFINDIYASQAEENWEVIRELFRCGYCYYFANILKIAFGRGSVCLAYPFGHIIWLDTDDVPYDIEGVASLEYEKLIDIDCIEELKYDFMHIRGLHSPPDTKQRVDILIAQHPEFIKQ